MRRGYIVAISFMTCLVGCRYYFGLTILEGNHIKFYGMICLVISVLLGSSCLSYLPRTFSNRLNFYCLIILSIIQTIPLLSFRWSFLEENLVGAIEVILPLVMVLMGGMAVIYLVIMRCREILSSKRNVLRNNSKRIRRKKKVQVLK